MYKKFFINKLTIAAFIFAIVYQVFMLGIYIYGYKYSLNHLNTATIVYLNDDGENGQKIVDSLKQQLPYQSESATTIDEAKLKVANHEAILLVNVPSNYSNQLLQGKTTNLHFVINSAGDQISSNAAKTIANELTKKLNESVTSQKMTKTIQQILLQSSQGKIEQAIQNQLNENPSIQNDPEALSKIKENITQTFESQLNDKANSLVSLNNVTSQIEDLNIKSNTTNYVISPMFIGLAGFVGAMTAVTILGKNFTDFLKKHRSKKWQLFGCLQLIYASIAIISSLIGIIIVSAINQLDMTQFVHLAYTNILGVFVSFQVLTLTNLLFGELSVLVNIPLVLVQSITSGSVIPYVSMQPIYQFFNKILPVPAIVQSNYDAIFNVKNTLNSFEHLVFIGFCAVIIAVIIIAIKFSSVLNNQKSVE